MALEQIKEDKLRAPIGVDAMYDVYIYHHAANTNDEVQDWERRATTKNPRRAILKAKSLHRSQSYKKVEVKKRAIDKKNNCVCTATLKTYEHKKNRKAWWPFSFSIFK